jgi:hypothetical protein
VPASPDYTGNPAATSSKPIVDLHMALAGLSYIVQGLVAGTEGFSSHGTVPGLLSFVSTWRG